MSARISGLTQGEIAGEVDYCHEVEDHDDSSIAP